MELNNKDGGMYNLIFRIDSPHIRPFSTLYKPDSNVRVSLVFHIIGIFLIFVKIRVKSSIPIL